MTMRHLPKTSILVLTGLLAAACSSGGDAQDSSEGASTENANVSEIYKTTDAIEHMVIRDGTDAQGQPLRTLIFAQQPKGASGDAILFELHHSGTKQIAILQSGIFQMAVRGQDAVYAVPQSGGLQFTGKNASGAYERFSSVIDDAGDVVLTSVAASKSGLFVSRDDGKILQMNDSGAFEEALDTHINPAFDSLPRQLEVVENAQQATLYWVDHQPSYDESGDTVIASVQLEKTTKGTLAIPKGAKATVFNGIDRAFALATDGKELFFTAWGAGEDGDEGYVGKISADGTVKHLVDGVRRPGSIAVDDNGVYFTTGGGADDDWIYRGGAVMTIARGAFGSAEGEAAVRCLPNTAGTAPAKIALSGTNLFWVENAAPTTNSQETHTGIFVWDKAVAWKSAQPCNAREAAHNQNIARY
jgi:hypothetical protein